MDRMRYESDGKITRILIDDGKANAMSVPFFAELTQLLDRAEGDGSSVVVIAGRTGMFSGGLDLKLLPTLSRDGLRELSETFARTMLRVFTFPLPTVAAVTGHAIAGGAVLAYACDRRYALDGRFRLQLNEVAIGIPMPSWMAAIGGSVIPPHLHVAALLHARSFAPSEALTNGMIDGLVAEGEDVVAHAIASCADLAAFPRDAYATTKRRLRAADLARVTALLPDELAG
ncbi:enoyl-CoA hydratase/isomerase family protein [Candidatus Binatia bacterium]|nr:enoyl-CoA hydratase/isomerase family protein [Candidatus Binatia bacterium]